MSTSTLAITGRCAMCRKNGTTTVRVWDGNGGSFWSNKLQHKLLALPQDDDEILIIRQQGCDPLIHIPLVLTCGKH